MIEIVEGKPFKGSRKRIVKRNSKKGSTTAGKKNKAPKRKSLVALLDKVFSQYIRLSFADKNGDVQCFTCPKKLPWKKMQNGHYISRSVRITRWDENNCRPQCYGCNIMHGGQPITFRENLVSLFGEVAVKQLENKRHKIIIFSDEWIAATITAYEEKVQRLSPSTI